MYKHSNKWYCTNDRVARQRVAHVQIQPTAITIKVSHIDLLLQGSMGRMGDGSSEKYLTRQKIAGFKQAFARGV